VPSQQHATQVLVPELELEVSTGTLGGLVTTVEGLVQAVQTALKSTQARLWQVVHLKW
jgi:C4-type Zn-finger protein